MNPNDWIIAAIAAVPTIASAVTAWAVLTGKGTKTVVTPSPLEVRGATRLATYEELRAVEKRIEKVETKFDTLARKIDADTKEILDAGEERAVRIHERIDKQAEKFAEALGELRGELKGRFAK